MGLHKSGQEPTLEEMDDLMQRCFVSFKGNSAEPQERCEESAEEANLLPRQMSAEVREALKALGFDA